MSKLISVKLETGVFEDAERHIKRAHISRNAYVNKAVRIMNRLQERRLMGATLAREAQALYGDTQDLIKEFDALSGEGLDR